MDSESLQLIYNRIVDVSNHLRFLFSEFDSDVSEFDSEDTIRQIHILRGVLNRQKQRTDSDGNGGTLSTVYDLTEIENTDSDALVFMSQYPFVEEVPVPAYNDSDSEFYVNHKISLDYVTITVNKVLADSDIDSDIKTEILGVSHNYIDRILSKSGWNDFGYDISSYQNLDSEILVQWLNDNPYVGFVEDSEFTAADSEFWSKKYNAASLSVSAINLLLEDSETTADSEVKIEVLTTNAKYLESQTTLDGYATFGYDVTPFQQALNKARVNIAVINQTLEAGVELQEFGSYYGDLSGTNDPDYFQYETAIPDSEYIATTINYSNIATTTSIQVKGYFLATYTGSHTFYTRSDDFSYLWIGDEAIAGYTKANAVVDNGGLHGAIETSGNINLVAGTYYPIRIAFGNNTGPGTFEASYAHSGQSKTNNWNGKVFYNTISTDGGY